MKIIAKIAAASIGLYAVAYVIGLGLPNLDCYGWECETVTCPPKMAVEIPGKGYLPCELFDEYIQTESEGLLIK